ncbi:MAG: NAD-dependent epimerase/dehydratase family protein [Candidatus Marinimicrobia bacterium]|nr:NAD-dependent epimerase/dehydratase family protein [Candidatus Neomarinimicrobiota bacterium]
MAQILVTGGAGFIGSHVADGLLARGHEVVILDDLSGGFRENLPAGADFVAGSITDHELVNRLFTKHAFEYVYHLAAYAAEGLSHFIKRYNYTNNLIGSVNLINAAVNAGTVRCFVFASSIAVYGSGQTPMREDMTPEPEDPYGIAKYAVELDLREARALFGLEHLIFRLHNVYGERQNIGDPYRNVIGIFMNQILQGRPMTLFGDGAQTRAFTYIGDVAPALAAAIEKPAAFNRVYNVGSDEPQSVRALADRVAAAMGIPPRVESLAERREAVHAFADHAAFRAAFGADRPMTPLAEGLAKMAAWVRRHGARQGRPFAAIEVARNLPPAWVPGCGGIGVSECGGVGVSE